MLTTSKLKVGESQFHYNQVIGAPLISIDVTMLKMEKVCVNVLRKHGKWRTDVMERISMLLRAHEMLKEELESAETRSGHLKKVHGKDEVVNLMLH
jgi:hypothetical protein